MRLQPIQIELRKAAKPGRNQELARFFKTGPGQYGEGDQFIGVTVPDIRKVAKMFQELPDQELSKLFKSPFHEDRVLAGMILVIRYQKARNLEDKEKIVRFYLKSREGLNNWDLVDLTAYKILGDFCLKTKDVAPILKLSKSKRHWDKRMAVVSTFALIREKQIDLILQLAELYLEEKEDLMHKAVGWMLREAGKRNEKALRQFIRQFGSRMPRTMLRYSIEKFSETDRKKILTQTKLPKS